MQTVRSLTIRLQLTRRLLSTSSHLRATPPFGSGPAPLRLPKEDQELYEKLQRSSTGAFSTPSSTVVVNQSLASSSSAMETHRPQINPSPRFKADTPMSIEQELENINVKGEAKGRGEEVHPDVRRGAKPEFEGDINPKTGEVRGPKNEPLRWGGGADWSYNGRVTDF